MKGGCIQGQRQVAVVDTVYMCQEWGLLWKMRWGRLAGTSQGSRVDLT